MFHFGHETNVLSSKTIFSHISFEASNIKNRRTPFFPFFRKHTPKLQNEGKYSFFDADLLSFALMLHALIPIQFWHHFDEQKTEQTQINQ
jgi:hypothetical protein